MRITVEVTDVTPAQWAWLLENVRSEREFAPDEVRMCVTFAAGERIMHREVGAGDWVRLITGLHRLTSLAEAVLTPDSLSYGAVPRRQYVRDHVRLREQYEGYSGL